jgi:uncharacterized protein YdhG (YjbR/CyaY superfamily)
MKSISKKFKTVGEYFASLPPEERKILKEVRKTIKEAAPGAEDVISYNIPAFRSKSILVWYAAFKEHISLFPKTSAINRFKNELSKYDVSKGTIKFPLNKRIPLSLIRKIVRFRVRELRGQ